MSEKSIFVVDGIEIESGSGAKITWKDRDFFELDYQGQLFLGEILDLSLIHI